MLAHESGKYVAALHVGWRGNRMEFPVSGVKRFCEAYGLRPRDVHAVRGPSLGPAAARFTDFPQEWGAAFRAWYTPATKTMNLWQLTRDQLIRAGLRPEHIYSLDLCTWSLPQIFFSHRRKALGRQGSLIWLAED